MNATQELIRRDHNKTVVPFGDGTNHQFSHSDLQHVQDPTGISVEEGEFLYGLIRICRPAYVLETGTNVGVSASYIALALEHNKHGHLVTIEHNGYIADIARDKLGKMGFTNVHVHTGTVESFQPEKPIEFAWLDSELAIRFGELERFYDQMTPGAIACIHDIWDISHPEFRGFPEKLKNLVKTGKLRGMSFKTPHGVMAFQKSMQNDTLASLFQ